MYFTLDSKIRTANDAAEIANLQRKGWVETIPPSYNPDTHYPPQWLNGQWVEGSEIPPAPPTVVTMRSFRLAAGRALMLEVDAVINAITDVDAQWRAQQFLATSPTVSRAHPLVIAIAAALGKSDNEVDAIFAAAEVIDNSA
jgi:hypothetical protein